MLNKSKIDGWKAEHFIAYLYMALADADSETTDEEVAMATRKTKKLFDEYFKSGHLNHAIVLQEVIDEIKEHSENDKTEIINELNKKFKLEDDLKTDIISDLTDIIGSDDKIQASEHYMLSFVRLLLSKN